jgi:hypothetical protein
MSHSYQSGASQAQVPFAGHPLGGLVREDRFDVPAISETDVLSDTAGGSTGSVESNGSAVAFDDWSGGFDFHLGVYARF